MGAAAAAGSALSQGESAGAVGVLDRPALGSWTMLTDLTTPLAVAYALLGGQSTNDRLDRMRSWLVGHNKVIMAVICLLLGAVLVANGVAAVAG